MSLLPAAVADQATLEKACGQRIHPKAFEVHPQGNRILVVVDEVPEELGGIYLPDSVRDAEQMGQGWVLSAGATVGHNVPHPGAPVFPLHPEGGRSSHDTCAWALVGQHIYFGTHIGRPLRLAISDREYTAGILMMTDRDILAIDTNPSHDPIKSVLSE